MSGELLIGVFSPTRKQCGDEHLPGCYNSWLEQTWCICGDAQWPGNVGTWHSRYVYESGEQGAAVVGYDVYFMPALPVGLPTQEPLFEVAS